MASNISWVDRGLLGVIRRIAAPVDVEIALPRSTSSSAPSCPQTPTIWVADRGPSLDPAEKRLAMQTEDHPIEYSDFEGVIPAGQYGAGTVMLWDRGTWQPDNADMDSALEKGEIKFTLHGEKLQGSWVLVRIRGFGKTPIRSAWLLIKHRDQYASQKDVTQAEPRSVASQRLLADIARDEGGDVTRAFEGDPAGEARAVARATVSEPVARRGRRL
jgi:bifunctional non-homologous end joining protein LigD